MVEIQPFTFDFKRFSRILEDEARAIFDIVNDEWAHETIYAYGLASYSEEFENLYPLVFTQAHLDRQIIKRRKRHYRTYKGMSLHNLRWYYRYRYHIDYRENDMLRTAFAQSNRMIAQGGSSLLGTWIDAAGKLTDTHADEMIQPHLTHFRATCINVLRQLNREGMFGRGKHRQNIILMIDYASYTDDDPAGRIVGALNPPEVVNRYRIEMAKASSFDMLIRRNRSQNKDR